MSERDEDRVDGSSKLKDLAAVREDSAGEALTTNQGLRIENDQDTLRAGARGPTLIEDFHFREKITHFDHERIPERVVHARGTGAHGFFQPYENASRFSKRRDQKFTQQVLRRHFSA